MENQNITGLRQLIDLFQHNLKQYKGKHYDEAKARADFIDKFFELLGWDVYNKNGYSEQYRDVVREDRVEIKGKVKCGNSLIGSDFYDTGQMNLFQDEETTRRINVFDWPQEFPDIFTQGGFDIIIGNPPYVRQEMLGEYKNYFETHYKVYNGIADIYVFFIEKGLNILKQGGYFGIIVANKWMRAGYGEQLRKFLKQKNILEIIDFGDLPVFQNVSTYPCILLISNYERKNYFKATIVESLYALNLKEYIIKKSFFVKSNYLNDNGWTLIDEKKQLLFNKFKVQGKPFIEYVKKKIYIGLKTGLNKAFVIDSETRKRLIAKNPKNDELIKPFLFGRDIKRYKTPKSEKYLIFIPKGWTLKHCKNNREAWLWFKKNYPAIAYYIHPFFNAAKKRTDKGDYWWELRACDYYSEFEKPKIIYSEIATKGQFTLDVNHLYCDMTAYILGTSSKYLLGILNSKLYTFMFSMISSEIRGGFFRWKRQYMSLLPIPELNFENQKEKNKYNKMVEMVEQMLGIQKKYHNAKTENEKIMFKKQIDILDNRIDQLVYELYGLTKDEIKIVEKESR